MIDEYLLNFLITNSGLISGKTEEVTNMMTLIKNQGKYLNYLYAANWNCTETDRILDTLQISNNNIGTKPKSLFLIL